MLDLEFLKYLKSLITVAKKNGIKKIELSNDRNEIDVGFIFNKNDKIIQIYDEMDNIQNDFQKEFQNIRKNDAIKLKKELNVKKVTVESIENFGEWMTVLIIEI